MLEIYQTIVVRVRDLNNTEFTNSTYEELLCLMKRHCSALKVSKNIRSHVDSDLSV